MIARILLAALLAAAPALAESPREAYAALLGRVVKRDGVDYVALRKERGALDRFIALGENANPGTSDRDRIAFWINMYNALTLQHVLDNWDGKATWSVQRDVDKFWDERKWTVAGRTLSLNDIEHTILRKEFDEPRIHFAVNCASRSCPALIPELYRGDTLDVVLAQQTRVFLADRKQNTFDLGTLRAELSSVFRWYKPDFEKKKSEQVAPLQVFLSEFAPTGTLARSLGRAPWTIAYKRYDWDLNLAGAAVVPPEQERDGTNPVWLVFYVIATAGLLLYGFHAFKMLFWRRRHGDAYREELRAARATSPLATRAFPKVLVQVPVYNEPGVVERAIDAVAGLDYPHESLEIHILDDSKDESTAIVDRVVARWQAAGKPIRVVRRAHRDGFKAGALAASLRSSDAEYVAVFDADFVPHADFIRRALPLFDAFGRVGCVQGRWGHLNREQNWLTRAQAVGVDAHFLVQQFGRAARGAFLNFNGTAGMWRRAAIEDAGGWRADTLTEDLDLSYRAQLNGWRIVFDPDLVVPAELPPTLGAFKSQQRRWACGSIQCARRLLGALWRSDRPFWLKTEATVHLCGYLVCVAMMMLVALLPLGAGHLPLLLENRSLWPLWCAIWLAACGPIVVSISGQWLRGRVSARDIFSCFLLGLGACANNAFAAIRGLSKPIRTFVRTPKQGSLPRAERTPTPVLELAMAAVTLTSTVLIANTQPIAVATYALFCSAGFCTLSAYWWAAER